ncbi:MAG TPA: methyltransferase domain-containing protein [Armatimonadota bacterium]|jgi:SAM-dependent methyltransferase
MTTSIKQAISTDIRSATCPACGYHVAVPFLPSEDMPLATLAWPEDAEAALAMPHLPLDFVRCIDCGHIYNPQFDYANVPYSSKPNLMFNSGALWSIFIQSVQVMLLSRLPACPTVVEIGHGDGSFLAALAKMKPCGRYIGFDPHGAVSGAEHVEFRAEYFEPEMHLPELTPDLIISRHVLEHFTNPLGFLQRMAFAALQCGVSPYAYFEVPCVDRVLETGRTVDFYYEHNSQFTTTSFTRMLTRCSAHIEQIGHGYDGEVVYGFMQLTGTATQRGHAEEAAHYHRFTRKSLKTIQMQLAELHRSGQQVAVWGGTGKSAAFMARYGMDAQRFPVVVDSDQAKVGTFAPGTGQEIRFRDWLIEHPAEVVIIPPQWRARDIIEEMQRHGIAVGTILIEHDGRLVDFHHDAHPYHADALGQSSL